MMQQYESLFKQLQQEEATTVLTPNRRLAATLHKHYQIYQTKQAHACWLTPDILPISTWLQRLWTDAAQQDIQALPLLLNPTQESFLWEKILLKTKASNYLLQVAETADLARSAWNLLRQWQVDYRQPIFSSSEDYLALQEWLQDYAALCTKNRWLDGATLTDVLIEKIETNKINPSKHILLLGFTEIAPQLKTLFTVCEAKNCRIETFTATQPVQNNQRISLIDTETEILTLARWAKKLYLQDINLQIGCVIPNLDKSRERVLQIFNEVFANEIELGANPFNLSAGKNLARLPLINIAIQCLGLFKTTLTLETFALLLSSPFIGDAEQERLKRYKYDRKLRQDNTSQINLSKLRDTDSRIYQSVANACPRLAERLKNFLDAIHAQVNEKYSYHEWAKIITNALTILGWPGERSLNSVEYQIVEAWLGVLTELQALDQVSAPVDYAECYFTLQKLATQNVFQAKTPTAPIQILGILEAASIPFDYLWVTGMDDVAWPPQPKPNPLIPKALQRDLHMPHATAERELSFCRSMLDQFKHAAPHVIFSHAETADDLELQASPLIRDLVSISLDALHVPDYISVTQQIFAAKKIETIFDDVAPPIRQDEMIRGGVSVLKQQALCPFKAYAEWRLHARELEQPLPGLRASDRGNIIHKILELLWNELQDQEKLLALDETVLKDRLDKCIADIVQHSAESHQEYPQYLALEKQRLFNLIYDWLQIEKQRPAFKVDMHEKNSRINIGPLQLNVRIDRIDQLSDGTKMIIDYKTGKYNDINTWFSERPEEPQLPLYSLLDKSNTSAISFAQVAQGEQCFKGVSRHALDIKGIKLIPEINKATSLSWDDQLSQWNTVLTQLSLDFYNGVATVDPKDARTTCDWCSLKPLCRIQEDI